MQKSVGRIAGATVLAAAVPCLAQSSFRPPAVPLVVSNPYLSIWSEADRLTDTDTAHWTYRVYPGYHFRHPLISLIRVDGKAFRLMGAAPQEVPAMPQTGLEVTPTRSIYHFATDQVRVTLTFMTPALPDDLDVFARPVTYLTWMVQSADGATHKVSLFDGAGTLLAVNSEDERVGTQTGTAGPLTWLRAGTEAQPVLGSKGDYHRINWGYAYVAAQLTGPEKASIGCRRDITAGFLGGDPSTRDQDSTDRETVMAFTFDLGDVGPKPVSRQVLVAYDEIASIRYFGKNLPPYWRRNGATPEKLLATAHRDYAKLEKRCERFDADLMADAAKAGGPKYAQMCALAYRQSLGACGLAVGPNKQPLYFPKENSSNGCMATVDVIYPGSPLLLLVSPPLLKAQLTPVLDYAASPRWTFPFAPHDLGTYPIAEGQVYGGGERTEVDQMPVEESGNMLLMLAALAHVEGNADYAAHYWPVLTKWAAFLREKGLDPENQLCTDDFAGHLAHNTNLSIKAILALGGYAQMADMLGKQAEAREYEEAARAMARQWVGMAADGDHTRLAFDKPGTWSQKYNLVWDRLLGLDLFPPSLARRELAFYKTVMQRYGLPLDNRMTLTKTDWSLWTATLTDQPEDAQAIIAPIYDYLNVTTARSPFVDSYETDKPASDGMHSRSVIGGVFIKMLSDDTTWHKWAARGTAKAAK